VSLRILLPRVLLTVLLAASGPAMAAEWSLNATAGQRFDYDTNRNIRTETDTDENGGSFGSQSTLNIRLNAATSRTRWRLQSRLRYDTFVGGDGEFDEINGIRPRIDGTMSYSGANVSFNGRAFFERRSTDFIDVEDEFIAIIDEEDELVEIIQLISASERDTTRDDIRLTAGSTVRLSPRTRLRFRADADLIRFGDDDPALRPSNTITLTAGWSRTLSQRTAVGLRVQGRRFTSDPDTTPESNETNNLTVTANVSRRLTPRLSFSLNAGARYTETDRDRLIGGVLVNDSDDTFGFNGGAQLTLRGARSSASLQVRQNVVPTTFGEVRNLTRISANYSQQLDSRTQFSLGGTFGLENELGGDGDEGSLRTIATASARANRTLTARTSAALAVNFSFENEIEDEAAFTDFEERISVVPTLNFRLSKNWVSNLGYRFRYRDNDDGGRTAHAVFVNFSRSFAILR